MVGLHKGAKRSQPPSSKHRAKSKSPLTSGSDPYPVEGIPFSYTRPRTKACTLGLRGLRSPPRRELNRHRCCKLPSLELELERNTGPLDREPWSPLPVPQSYNEGPPDDMPEPRDIAGSAGGRGRQVLQ